jgi:hypothetical protein
MTDTGMTGNRGFWAALQRLYFRKYRQPNIPAVTNPLGRVPQILQVASRL